MFSGKIYFKTTNFINIKIPYVKLELALVVIFERLIHYKQENSVDYEATWISNMNCSICDPET